MPKPPALDHSNEHSGMVFVWLAGMAATEVAAVWLIVKCVCGVDILWHPLYNAFLR